MAFKLSELVVDIKGDDKALKATLSSVQSQLKAISSRSASVAIGGGAGAAGVGSIQRLQADAAKFAIAQNARVVREQAAGAREQAKVEARAQADAARVAQQRIASTRAAQEAAQAKRIADAAVAAKEEERQAKLASRAHAASTAALATVPGMAGAGLVGGGGAAARAQMAANERRITAAMAGGDVQEAQRLMVAQAGLRTSLEATTTAKGKAGRASGNLAGLMGGATRMSGGLSQRIQGLGHIMDDMQYVGMHGMGLRPVINNLMQVAPLLGMAALGADLAFRKWEFLKEGFGKTSLIGQAMVAVEGLGTKLGFLNTEEDRLEAGRKKREADAKAVGSVVGDVDAERAAGVAEALAAMGGGPRVIEDLIAVQKRRSPGLDVETLREAYNRQIAAALGGSEAAFSTLMDVTAKTTFGDALANRTPAAKAELADFSKRQREAEERAERHNKALAERPLIEKERELRDMREGREDLQKRQQKAEEERDRIKLMGSDEMFQSLLVGGAQQGIVDKDKQALEKMDKQIKIAEDQLRELQDAKKDRALELQ